MADFMQNDLDELMEVLSDISFYLRRIDRKLEALPQDIAYKMGYQPTPFPQAKSSKGAYNTFGGKPFSASKPDNTDSETGSQ